jgi:AraC-like DNA-binding protein
MIELKERTVKEETEEAICGVIEKSYPTKVTVVEKNSFNPEKVSIFLCLNKSEYKFAGNKYPCSKGETLLLPVGMVPQFADKAEFLHVKIRKMATAISRNSGMPTTLLCSEDRYEDFSIHSDISRLIKAEQSEAVLLAKLIFFDIKKLIDLNNSNLLNSSYAKFLSAMAFIGDNRKKNLNRVEIAEALDICPDYLNTLFKKYHGASFSQHVIGRKMEYSRTLLKSGLKISQVAKQIAYKSDVHYSSLFKKIYGLSPKKIQLLMHKKRALTFGERERLYCRVGFKILVELPPEDENRLGCLNPALRSSEVELSPSKNYVILFENTTNEKGEVFWLDEKGGRISHGFIEPGQRMESSTQSNRIWVIESPNRTAVYLTPVSNCTVVF